jgi:hypothetical protein
VLVTFKGPGRAREAIMLSKTLKDNNCFTCLKSNYVTELICFSLNIER